MKKGLIGFQRAYNEDRVRQARDYFKIEKNQSPTSLIIGMHPRSDDSNCYAHIIFDDDENQTSNTQNIRKCKVKIEMRFLSSTTLTQFQTKQI